MTVVTEEGRRVGTGTTSQGKATRTGGHVHEGVLRLSGHLRVDESPEGTNVK